MGMKIQGLCGLLCLWISVANAQTHKFTERPIWSTSKGKVMVYGTYQFNIRGMNWWGQEGPRHVPHGMHKHNIDWHLDVMQKWGINTLRYPLSIESSRSDKVTLKCSIEPDLCNGTPLDFMEAVIDKAADRGIMVMLDLHTLRHSKLEELWHNDEYSVEDALDFWDRLVGRFKGKWNVFAADLFNEPHGRVTWGTGTNETDWRAAATRFIHHINDKHPDFKGLFFVSGLCCYFKRWFGTIDLANQPIDTGDAGLNNRVVYTVHHYRPGRLSVGEPFPDDFIPALNNAFLKVEQETENPLVIGEWGGDYTNNDKDKMWMNKFQYWMRKNCVNDNFYWALHTWNEPMRGMTSMEDYTTQDIPKWRLLTRTQPSPTKITKTGDEYTLEVKEAKCGDNM